MAAEHIAVERTNRPGEVLGNYVAHKGGQHTLLRVLFHPRGYEIVWSNGRRVTIQRESAVVRDVDPMYSVRYAMAQREAMKETVRMYLDDWHARRVTEVISGDS